jgi:hypothetical protein
VAGIILSISAVIIYIAARQPYAGIVCFVFLVIKGFLIAGTPFIVDNPQSGD